MSGCACGVCQTCRAGSGPAFGSTVIGRLAPTVDSIRRRYTDLGLYVYDVFLVWTKWTGRERGEGAEKEVLSIPIFPRPKVDDLTAISFNAYSAGVLPVGSVRVSQISMQLTEDNLRGTALPDQAYCDGCSIVQPGGGTAIVALDTALIAKFRATASDFIPETYEFFYEIVEGDVERARRRKFRILGDPYKRPGKFDWSIVLERISEDRDRDGKSQIGPDTGEYD